MSLILLLFGTFFGMCLIGVPVSISLSISALVTGLTAGINPIVVCQQMYAQMDSFTLLAIPMFLLVGTIMENGKVTERLVGFAQSLVGHITGGLGHVNIVSNMIMAGMSGSGTADAAALGGVMIPAMKRAGYPSEMAAAINASAATVGPIIPPSIMMVIYGAYGGTSIAALFIGGFLPGVIICATLMAVVYRWCKKNNFHTKTRRATFREILKATWDASLSLLVPIIIIVGIMVGIFTATESSMIAVVYSLVLVLFVYRTCTPREVIGIFQHMFVESARPLFCAGGAGAFSFMMAYLKVPQLIMQLAGPIAGNTIGTLIFVTILYIILGTFMDSIPAIIIFLPVILQMAAAANIDTVHLGVLVTVVLCFGLLTPPYGMTLFLSASIAGVSSTKVMSALKWFYIVYLAIIGVLIFVPDLILFLPRMIL